jgi:hypothetical protein
MEESICEHNHCEAIVRFYGLFDNLAAQSRTEAVAVRWTALGRPTSTGGAAIAPAAAA